MSISDTEGRVKLKLALLSRLLLYKSKVINQRIRKVNIQVY